MIAGGAITLAVSNATITGYQIGIAEWIGRLGRPAEVEPKPPAPPEECVDWDCPYEEYECGFWRGTCVCMVGPNRPLYIDNRLVKCEPPTCGGCVCVLEGVKLEWECYVQCSLQVTDDSKLKEFKDCIIDCLFSKEGEVLSGGCPMGDCGKSGAIRCCTAFEWAAAEMGDAPIN